MNRSGDMGHGHDVTQSTVSESETSIAWRHAWPWIPIPFPTTTYVVRKCPVSTPAARRRSHLR